MVHQDRQFSPYYDQAAVARSVAEGHHRDVVGGLWDEIGLLQFEFLKARGLQSDHKLLDIGCGCMRGGVHFVRYLDPGNYFGVDLNQSLLDAGYEVEIKGAGLQSRLPREQLRCDSEFDVSSFGIVFDFALALSVFTHLPLNAIRICLERTIDVVPKGRMFFATFFELPETEPSWQARLHPPASVRTHGASDPYHYRQSDLRHAAANLAWSVHYIGEFDHPRGQRMVAFVRV